MAAFLLDHLIYSVKCLLRYRVCAAPWRALPVPLDLYPWFPGCWACFRCNSMCTARKLFMLWDYLLTLMHEEIIPKKPLKNTVHAARNSGNSLGWRETFQSGQKYGSLSKDLCHPGVIVWCSFPQDSHTWNSSRLAYHQVIRILLLE